MLTLPPPVKSQHLQLWLHKLLHAVALHLHSHDCLQSVTRWMVCKCDLCMNERCLKAPNILTSPLMCMDPWASLQCCAETMSECENLDRCQPGLESSHRLGKGLQATQLLLQHSDSPQEQEEEYGSAIDNNKSMIPCILFTVQEVQVLSPHTRMFGVF